MAPTGPAQTAPQSVDEQALARYRYLLRTAPPDAIEQVHAEAFARLSPQQRAQVLREIAASVPPHERSALNAAQGDPYALARVATRAEMRQPGFLEHTLGRPGGMSTGAVLGTTLLGSFLASMAGSLIAQQIFSSFVPPGMWGGAAPYDPGEGYQGDLPAAQGDEAQADQAALDAETSGEAEFTDDFGGSDFSEDLGDDDIGGFGDGGFDVL